jgi:hypothetical protein
MVICFKERSTKNTILQSATPAIFLIQINLLTLRNERNCTTKKNI